MNNKLSLPSSGSSESRYPSKSSSLSSDAMPASRKSWSDGKYVRLEERAIDTSVVTLATRYLNLCKYTLRTAAGYNTAGAEKRLRPFN